VRENHVVEFEEGRLVAWKPAEPGRPPVGHLWRWELEPRGDARTLVRHTYDWTDLHDESRLEKARATTAERLAASLDRLAALVERSDARASLPVLADAELVAFLPTTDLDRAAHWFGETLGMSLIETSPFACVFDAHGTTLRVTKVDSLVPAPYTVLGWVVTDLHAAVLGLDERGVLFERFPGMDQDDLGIWTTPGGDLVAWFKDPDRNVLSLTQLAHAAP
jgi:catechol 2,3-dioxygenase-like lactoylglutathione lyase family enzyme